MVTRYLLAAICCLGLCETTAHGWGFKEHSKVGEEAYRLACEKLRDDLGKTQAGLPKGWRDRLHTACFAVNVQAGRYGWATAIAGDHLGRPSDFLLNTSGRLRTSKVNYGRLAMRNATHFMPLAKGRWKHFHDQALNHALDAAELEGTPRGEAFKKAFYYAAFADHFLQDSFAAGHHGFNRDGSGSAASQLAHDQYNSTGRHLMDGRGKIWLAFGDGYLDTPRHTVAISLSDADAAKWKEQAGPRVFIEPIAGRRALRDAGVRSVYDFIATFVTGRREPHRQTVLSVSFPVLLDVAPVYSGNNIRRVGESKPARVDRALLAQATLFTDGDKTLASPIAVDFFYDIFPSVSARVSLGMALSSRSRSGMGAVARMSIGTRRLHSWNGTASHQLQLGLVVGVTGESDGGMVAVNATYAAGIEIGYWLIQVEGGPLLSPSGVGMQLGVGFGKAIGWRGGG